MKIIIAGYGFVGKAVANSIKDHYELHIVDPQYTTAEIEHCPDADGIIICVGTPMNALGDCDVSQIRSVLDKTPVEIPVLIKSTVRPDYLNKLVADYPHHNISYSPEFLRAATANEDFANQEFMIIGGNGKELWINLFQQVLPKCKSIYTCSLAEASLAKYTINCFLSVKVSFFNQLFDICQAAHIDYETVKTLVSQDDRIGSSHMQVPGTDGIRGFGGACFPKDTNAFMHYADSLQISHTLVESAIKYNKKLRKTLT